MQNTYHSQIPQLGYITWLDKLYLLAYLASILMLINAVISKGDWFNNGKIDICVMNDGILYSNKGVNIPNGEIIRIPFPLKDSIQQYIQAVKNYDDLYGI